MGPIKSGVGASWKLFETRVVVTGAPRSLHPTPVFFSTPLCGLSHSVVSESLRPHGLEPSRFLCPWNFPGKNTGMGCHFLLQGSLPNWGTEPTSLESPAFAGDSLPLHHIGSPSAPIHSTYFSGESRIAMPGTSPLLKSFSWLFSSLKDRIETLPWVWYLLIKTGILVFILGFHPCFAFSWTNLWFRCFQIDLVRLFVHTLPLVKITFLYTFHLSKFCQVLQASISHVIIASEGYLLTCIKCTLMETQILESNRFYWNIPQTRYRTLGD